MKENLFKRNTIKEIKERLPGCTILHGDPNYTQGIPDTFILYGSTFAVLEFKRHTSSSRRPNQYYYIEMYSKYVYAEFINPENKEKTLNEMEQSLKAHQYACSFRGVDF